jgi:hypothetical protein
MVIVEIQNVTQLQNKEHLWGSYIDLPKPGGTSDIYAIDVMGWVLGKTTPVTAVEFHSNGQLHQSLLINMDRKDIAHSYSHVPNAVKSGFRTRISVVSLPQEFEIKIDAVLQNGAKHPIGSITGKRQAITNKFIPIYNPLMVTTFGRTGSTWLMQLLDAHEEIISYRPFQYEPRVASYWIEVLKALSEPTSYLQMLSSSQFDKTWWLGNTYFPAEATAFDPSVQRWLGYNNVDIISTFCQSRIEAFYDQVASLQKKFSPKYFAEKFAPDNVMTTLIWEMYPLAKEILLVRDFRDMLCSVLAYNKKKGITSFGRELTYSDEEYVKYLRGYAAYMLQRWKRQTPKVFLLRYEDLIMHPHEALESVFEYLAVNANVGYIQEVISKAQSSNQDQQAIHRTASSSVDSIGRWKSDLDKKMQDLCNETFGDVLKEFGYEV